MTEEERFWIALDNLPGMNAWRFADLYTRYRTREHFLKCQNEHGVKPFDVDALLASVNERLARCHAHAVFCTQDAFPSRLRDIPSPPPILYYIGDLSLAEERGIAVIGSRRHTSYGAACARTFASAFAMHGLCVISGMADGIDGTAQRAALENDGKTVAVLAGGIDHIYPAGNRDLYYSIAQNGLLLSESPPGTKPIQRSFPHRNRLISGLSEALLVVEAAFPSGTMSTVEHALAQNKTVYAIPGSILSPMSEGTNRLIQDGCLCAIKPQDVLEACGIRAAAPAKAPDPLDDPSLTDVQRRILHLLEKGARFFEDLQTGSGTSADECNMALTMLEISGYITKEAGRQYEINQGR